MRIFVAYVLCPLVPTLYFLLAPFLPLLFGQEVFFNSSFILSNLTISLPVSYLSCYLIGLPYLSILKQRNLYYSEYIMLGAAVVGGIVFCFFGLLLRILLDSSGDILPTFKEMVPYFLAFFPGALFGLSVAVPFCLVLRIPGSKPNKRLP